MTDELARPGEDERASRRRYWRSLKRWTAGLLLVWFVAAFGVVFFARQLRFSFFGWPFSFWWAAQGALLVFLALVVLYAHVARRLDLIHGVDEQD